jgi:hypothetical protein
MIDPRINKNNLGQILSFGPPSRTNLSGNSEVRYAVVCLVSDFCGFSGFCLRP